MLSVATLVVTVMGMNDDAAISVAGGDTASGQVVEDGTTATAGTLSFTDVDLADVHTVAVASTPAGTLGALTASKTADTNGSGTGGTVAWNYTVDNSAIQNLAEGESKVETFTVQLFDGTSTVAQTVTVTVSGTNDVPTAVGDVVAVNEDATTDDLTAVLLSNDTDVDNGAILSILSVGEASFGTLSLTTEGLTYTADAALLDALAAGATTTDTFAYTVRDEFGASSTATALVTITGVNDAPDAVDDSTSTFENAAITINVLSNDTDVDGDVVSVLALSGATSSLGASLIINAVGKVAYDPTASATLAALTSGQSLVDSFTYTVTDAYGATATATVNVTVSGASSGFDINTVGYYDMRRGFGTAGSITPIEDAGMLAVNLDTLSVAELSTVDALFITNSSNTGYGLEYQTALPQIANFVFNGGVLIFHDRRAEGAEALLPGIGETRITRLLGVEIDFVDDLGLIAQGPAGTLTDDSLDDGDFSYHGFVVEGTLLDQAVPILTTDHPNQVVTFAYTYGQGAVVYSTVPLDDYLDGFNSLDPIMLVYATNLLSAFDSGNNIFG